MRSVLGASLASLLLLSSCQSKARVHFNEIESLIQISEERVYSSPILYKVRSFEIAEAMRLYQKLKESRQKHDSYLLKQISTIILEQGMRQRDPEALIFSLFGISLSRDQNLLPLISHSLKIPHPQLQIAGLNLLASLDDEHANQILLKGFQSPYFLLRLESAYHLAQKKRGFEQTLNLMHKIEPELRPLFPQLFAMIGGENSTHILRMLLNDPDLEVRLQTLLAIAQFQRDPLLPEVRNLSLQIDPLQQEACIFALGKLKDHQSIPFLKKMTQSSLPQIHLLASYVLYNFGQKDQHHYLLEQARLENPFAISLLGDVDEAVGLLVNLMESPKIQTRLNATLALLKHRDARTIQGLREILICDHRDFAFQGIYSQAKTIQAWRAIPSSGKQKNPHLLSSELSLSFKEKILQEAQNLPEETFLRLAQDLFSENQKALIPTLIFLLENLGTDQAIQLLKYEQQHVGSPLIRAYCTLALFRLGEEEAYEKALKTWISRHLNSQSLYFRPILPWSSSMALNSYTLTPNEQAQLLVSALLALANTHKENHIDFLIQALANSNDSIRYMLAGILIHSSI